MDTWKPQLVALPEEKVLEQFLLCVKCGKIPAPDYYFVCKENGHNLCGRCAWPLPQDPKVENKKDAGPEECSSCCAPGNLSKGNPRILELLLTNTMWKCVCSDFGCKARVPGVQWDAHSKLCREKFAMSCKYYNCSEITYSVPETVKHLEDVHQAAPMKGPTYTMTVGHRASLMHRMVGLLHFRERYFLFSSQVSQGLVYMWVWHLVDDNIDTPVGDYSLTLYGAGKVGKGFKLDFSAPPVPYKITAERVMASQLCLIIPEGQLYRVCENERTEEEDDAKMTWTVQVTFEEKN